MTGPTDYDDLADRYAAGIDDRPWNELYERPATIALLPSVDGKDVLDAGCGSGWYTEWLADHGARTTGIDRSARMVEYAHMRLRGRATVQEGDASDLRGLRDASFDLIVSSLVIHYVHDLDQMFREWARVLRPDGTFVLSTHHPMREVGTSSPAGYLATSLVEEHWRWLGATMRFYQRPLRALADPIANAGFVIERISEPTPSDALRDKDPRGHASLCRMPAFIFIRARKG